MKNVLKLAIMLTLLAILIVPETVLANGFDDDLFPPMFQVVDMPDTLTVSFERVPVIWRDPLHDEAVMSSIEGDEIPEKIRFIVELPPGVKLLSIDGYFYNGWMIDMMSGVQVAAGPTWKGVAVVGVGLLLKLGPEAIATMAGISIEEIHASWNSRQFQTNAEFTLENQDIAPQMNGRVIITKLVALSSDTMVFFDRIEVEVLSGPNKHERRIYKAAPLAVHSRYAFVD